MSYQIHTAIECTAIIETIMGKTSYSSFYGQNGRKYQYPGKVDIRTK